MTFSIYKIRIVVLILNLVTVDMWKLKICREFYATAGVCQKWLHMYKYDCTVHCTVADVMPSNIRTFLQIYFIWAYGIYEAWSTAEILSWKNLYKRQSTQFIIYSIKSHQAVTALNSERLLAATAALIFHVSIIPA